MLQTRLHEAGIRHDISHRRKDFVSFYRKALAKKAERPFEQIRDLAGVRVVVPFFAQRERVARVVQTHLDAEGPEDTESRYLSDQFWYRGLHFQVRLRDEDIVQESTDLRGLESEVQVLTRAEAAWSEAGHDLTYKPRVDPPRPTRRRIARLVALVELFDEQMARAQEEFLAIEGFSEAVLLAALERHFLPLSRREFDRRLSLEILEHVQRAFSGPEIEAFETLMSRFVAENRDLLARLLSLYAADRERVLLFQPEALAVFERLDTAPISLVRAWDAALPPELLDSLAAVWGKSLAPYRGQP